MRLSILSMTIFGIIIWHPSNSIYFLRIYSFSSYVQSRLPCSIPILLTLQNRTIWPAMFEVLLLPSCGNNILNIKFSLSGWYFNHKNNDCLFYFYDWFGFRLKEIAEWNVYADKYHDRKWQILIVNKSWLAPNKRSI